MRFVLQLPWAKVAYTAILIFVALLLLGESARIWFAQQVYVGTFRYFVDDKEDEARGLKLQTLVLHQHKMLAELFSMEAGRIKAAKEAAEKKQDKDPQAETVPLPAGAFDISDSRTVFSDVELTVQGINLAQIMTALRRAVSPPNEITGSIGRMGNAVTGVVQWPNAPSRAGEMPPSRALAIAGAREDTDIAFDIACGLIWTEEVANAESPFGGMSRVDFCIWARAWSNFVEIRSRREAGYGLADADVEVLKDARSKISDLISRKVDFRANYLLRADIVSNFPAPTEEDKQQIAKDREEFTRPIVTLEAIVSENARPVLAFSNGKLLTADVPEIWKDSLQQDAAVLETAATRVGFLRRGKGSFTPYEGSAFVIGKDLVATASFTADVLTDIVGLGPLPDKEVEFVLGESVSGTDAKPFTVTEIVYLSSSPDDRGLAILKVPGLADAGILPLEIDDSPYGAETKIAAIGYPAAGRHLPEEFAALFGSQYGVRTLMPGIVTGAEGEGVTAQLNHDASTTAGVGGGPLVRLDSGKVIAVHLGGMYMGNQIKSNFAVPLASALPPATRAALGIGPSGS